MYHPRLEMAQFPQVPQIENGKPDFSAMFQKVELRNTSTFFQLAKPGDFNGKLAKREWSRGFSFAMT